MIHFCLLQKYILSLKCIFPSIKSRNPKSPSFWNSYFGMQTILSAFYIIIVICLFCLRLMSDWLWHEASHAVIDTCSRLIGCMSDDRTGRNHNLQNHPFYADWKMLGSGMYKLACEWLLAQHTPNELEEAGEKPNYIRNTFGGIASRIKLITYM